MKSVTINQARKAIELADLDRGEIVPCLVGPPGIGKTQTVYQFAEQHGRRVVEMILSQRLPTEVSGLVMPDPEKKSMEVFDHSRLASLEDGDILLFDELLEAPPMVLSACLTLIQERRLMSGRKLPDILIVAATNPTASPNMNKVSLRQRFMWLEVKWDKHIWSNWILDNLGIEIDYGADLMSLITTDGSGYNILTPRTASKLLALGKKVLGNDDKYNQYLDIVEDMFDPGVRRAFNQVFKSQSPKIQILNAVDGVVDPDTFLKMKETSISDMMELLQGLDTWDEIAKSLVNIQLEER